MAVLEQKKESGKGRGHYTIRDIARLAGVSRSTVSLALNDSPKINAKTKASVLELIERVGYRPNQVARNLVRQSSASLCVILPKIDHVVSDVYFSEALSGIIEATTQAGFHLMVEVATEDFRTDRKAWKLFRQGAIDGILCIGNLTTDVYLKELADGGCPVVLVNSSISGIPQVLAANADAAYRATKHLHALGHKRIAHIRGSELVTTAAQRTAGYMKACKELGINCSDDLIAEGHFDTKSGYLATKWLLSHKARPTAIFTTNDVMAIGAIEACEELGLRVPEDIAIFGGDDIQLARYVRPRLSTMRQDMFTIGKFACNKLLQILEGNDVQDATEVAVKLVVRESCGAYIGGRTGDEKLKALVNTDAEVSDDDMIIVNSGKP